MKRRLTLLFTLVSLIVGWAQARTVTGLVTEASTGDPVIGASVRCRDNLKIGTTTNLDGKFTLNVPDDCKHLMVSFTGMETQEVQVANYVTVALKESLSELDEVVVVGYSTTTKRDLISSVSTVNASQIVNLPVTNVIQGMAGRSPGVIIRASGGGINNRPNVSIRGGGTPLYVIDGIIRTEDDFANLAPDDIKDISILKDASATAIYGSRASNGIIQVTTFNGKNGKPTLEYDFNASWSQPNIWPEQMDVWDRAEWINKARASEGLTTYFDERAIQKMKDGSDPLTYSITHWRKAVLRS
ncbi:MAG: TonB-dependent receptor plug domain-containing protein, partial [Muribaculaceae bacterium]|nr:TonB-dependent receptor plug domain-containing protein [Muribaculaceae bacterium]